MLYQLSYASLPLPHVEYNARCGNSTASYRAIRRGIRCATGDTPRVFAFISSMIDKLQETRRCRAGLPECRAARTAFGSFAMTVRKARADASGVLRPPSQCLTASRLKPKAFENAAWVMCRPLRMVLDINLCWHGDLVAFLPARQEFVDFAQAFFEIVKHRHSPTSRIG